MLWQPTAIGIDSKGEGEGRGWDLKELPSSESFTDGDLLRPIFWKPHLLVPSNGRFKYMMDMMDDDGRIMSEKRESEKGGLREKRKSSLEKSGCRVSKYDVTVGHTLVHAHVHHQQQQTNSGKKRTARAAIIIGDKNVMLERSFGRLKK
ncbi:uncharacterized protein ARB_01544 [Trichophyton benhamiae CBS 112371]|uniref:Uncharacterized protein n=1 Tax=Arthroderma benhamiae (strain ATCC MYA-4681 / CBS 112371) TaxID=663331 RepID=D4AZC4_ARTBC|nr:uncharacterized protein ARB_01544 [Trichophyton benhamiae CBS 112371]EFE31644.1 hypothetical protein ARB_01544 [Trichophyton benhamiae CBS 112371]